MAYEKISTLEEAFILSEIAAGAGAMMLANGAETYRVEDTAEIILRSNNLIKDVDIFATFNVIIISFSYKGQVHTNVRRVKARSNNLYYVDKLNTFSREFSLGKYSLDQAIEELDKIKKSEGTSRNMKILGATLAAGAFSLLIGAGIKEVIFSFLVGFLGYVFSLFLENNKLSYFVVHFLYGLLISSLTLIIDSFIPISVNVVIISSLMAFLPGIMITNAVRDLMSGDALSGMTGASLAILISIALALGVAMPLGLFGFFKIWDTQ